MSDHLFGARPTSDGVSFRLWAPAAKRVDLMLQQRHAHAHVMQRGAGGWFTAEIAGLAAGARYKFRIDDEIDVPDPASLFQPDDVFGASEVIDHALYAWRAADWRGRPWAETVLIESHVGTFTEQGSYLAMIDKLDHLVQSGITALELLPIADFAGARNWGYDGVLWYAPDSAYGRPEHLKALIDEAHLRGLTVFLDVVYNHFGPEGNYLGRYAPSFFTDAQTPWGNVIDYRVPEVRSFAIGNALSWLRDYRFDGLRLDAVNAIIEPGEISMLHDLSAAAGQLAAATGRHIHLVLENGDNLASLLDAEQDPPQGKFRAQWNDDYHHCWHVLLTGERNGYYQDYETPLQDLARALGSGFVYQGEASAFRGGQLRGEASGGRSPQPPSSTSCKTMTRLATARWATGWKVRPMPRRSRPPLPSPCSLRWCRCCSWARNGARAGRSRSSATSRVISPTPFARGVGGNMIGRMRNMAIKFLIRSMPPPSRPQCSTGPSATRAQGRIASPWCAACLRSARARSSPGLPAQLSAQPRSRGTAR